MSYRGVPVGQDARYQRMRAQERKSRTFPPIFRTPVTLKRIKVDVLLPWIDKRLVELGVDDDVIIGMVAGALKVELVDGLDMFSEFCGLLGEELGGKFATELWELMVSAQQHPAGVPQQFVDEMQGTVGASTAVEGSTADRGTARGATGTRWGAKQTNAPPLQSRRKPSPPPLRKPRSRSRSRSRSPATRITSRSRSWSRPARRRSRERRRRGSPDSRRGSSRGRRYSSRGRRDTSRGRRDSSRGRRYDRRRRSRSSGRRRRRSRSRSYRRRRYSPSRSRSVSRGRYRRRRRYYSPERRYRRRRGRRSWTRSPSYPRSGKRSYSRSVSRSPRGRFRRGHNRYESPPPTATHRSLISPTRKYATGGATSVAVAEVAGLPGADDAALKGGAPAGSSGAGRSRATSRPTRARTSFSATRSLSLVGGVPETGSAEQDSARLELAITFRPSSVMAGASDGEMEGPVSEGPASREGGGPLRSRIEAEKLKQRLLQRKTAQSHGANESDN